MSRKPITPLEHVKTVKRNGVSYLYFNSGEKRDGKTIYTALGRAGTLEVGARYSAALKKRRGRSGAALTSVTVDDLVKLYERSTEFMGKSVGTQKTYMVYHRRMVLEFAHPVGGSAPAGEVEDADIYRLMDKMVGNPAAIDMLLLAGKNMFTWAKKRRYVAANPFLEVDREAWETIHYLPWPETVLEAGLTDERLWLPVALMYYTGQRIGDCCKMRWSDIEVGEGSQADTIYVKQQKTGKEVWPPIHSHLAEILAELPYAGEGTILRSPRGGPAKDATLRDWIKQLGARLGVALVPHGLRKNAVNALLDAECSVAQVSAITGQSLRIVELYAKQRETKGAARVAGAKWERASNRKQAGKTRPEMAE